MKTSTLQYPTCFHPLNGIPSHIDDLVCAHLFHPTQLVEHQTASVAPVDLQVLLHPAFRLVGRMFVAPSQCDVYFRIVLSTEIRLHHHSFVLLSLGQYGLEVGPPLSENSHRIVSPPLPPPGRVTY